MQPANENDMRPQGERRRALRQRVLLRGRILSTRSPVTGDCTIRNLSSQGALVALNPEAVAADPVLILVRDGMAYESRIAWQSAVSAGVQFLSTVDLRGPLPPRLQRAPDLAGRQLAASAFQPTLAWAGSG